MKIVLNLFGIQLLHQHQCFSKLGFQFKYATTCKKIPERFSNEKPQKMRKPSEQMLMIAN